ncbi:hypothetical protein M885DRAFT_622476 [Pelagophyceae sp. CCMP2097]|nr:hypothetical protein M885DRAFT_622476 [Pelagophyceae sp. CCMP2097]
MIMPSALGDARANLSLEAAGMAAMRGAWRQCADAYLEAYNVCGSNWPLRYNCLSGFASVLCEDHFKASPADLQALGKVGKDVAAPRLDRVKAHFSRGYARKALGDREGAARSYRCCIEVSEAASAADRRRTVILPNVATRQYAPSPCGPIFDGLLATARDNLAPMERRGVPMDVLAMAGAMAHRYRQNLACGHDPAAAEKEAFENCRPRFIGRGLNDDVVLSRLTTVGGATCDCCGAARPAGASLLCCARCRLAFFCDKECFRKAWKKGHKAACRAPGEVRAGDRVLLVGVPGCEDWVVEALRERADAPGNWDVCSVGGNAGEAQSVNVAHIKRLRPPA